MMTAQACRARAVVQRLPNPRAPSSWYHLVWSNELTPNGPVRLVRAFGRDLIVWRTAAGEARLSAAACGHCGHNRAAVCLEAAGDLRCVCGQALAADPDLWPVSEKRGFIFAYYDSAGRPPMFAAPDLPDVEAWRSVGRLEWIFPSHVQEVVENAVDLGHFHMLHGFAGRPTLEHFSTTQTRFDVSISGPKKVWGVTFTADLSIHYTGMGVSMCHSTRPVPFTTVTTWLPKETDLLSLRLSMYLRVPKAGLKWRGMGPLIRWQVKHDLRDEIEILSQKRYWERPVLAEGDGPIVQIRRWCQQFYPTSVA